jgi:Carbohydrate binding domain/Kelch motif
MDEQQWRAESSLEEPVSLEGQESVLVELKKKRHSLWPLWLILTTLIAGGMIIALSRFRLSTQNTSTSTNVAVQEVNLGDIERLSDPLDNSEGNKVVINGSIETTEGIVLTPISQPESAADGQLYIDQSTGRLLYYNSGTYVAVAIDDGTLCTTSDADCESVTNITNITNVSGTALPQGLDITDSPQFAGLNLKNGGGGLVLIQSSASSGTFTLTLPTDDGNLNECLLTDGSGVLSFGICPSAASVDLQTAYDNGNIITTMDARNLEINLADTATDSDYIINLAGTGSNFELRDSGTAFLVASDGGSVNLQNTVNSTSAFRVQNSAGTVDVFNVDTTNGRVGIGNSAPTQALDVTGNIVASGTLETNDVASIGSGSSLTTATLNLNHTFDSSDSCLSGCFGLLNSIILDNPTSPTLAVGQSINLQTSASAFTLTDAIGLRVNTPVVGGGSAITNAYGIRIDNQTAGTNDYGVYIQGADTYALWADAGNSRLDGNLSVGTGATATAQLDVGGGSGTTIGAIISNGTSTGNVLSLRDNATDVLTISDGGSALFRRNTTDSTTSFQIQNAAGGQLFGVDSTNSVLSINANNTGELQAWQTGTALPAARFGHGSVIYGGNIYVVAGNNGSPTTEVRYTNLFGNGSLGTTWSTTTDALPGTAMYPATTTTNGHVYVLGGEAASSSVTDDVYFGRILPGGDVSNWQTSDSKLYTAVMGGQAVVNGDYMYLIGGSTTDILSTPDPTTAVTTVQYAKVNPDGSLGTFATTAALPAGRTGGSAVVANGYIYYVGGMGTTGVATTTVYYALINSDGTLSSWTSDGDTLPAARAFGAASVQNGYLYYYGGGSGAGSGNSSVYYWPINATNGSVGTVVTATNSITAARSSFSYATSNGYVYALGGFNIASLSTVHYTSGSRIRVAGSLDLVNITGANQTAGGLGGTLTAGNTTILGNLRVSQTAQFNRNVVIDGSFLVGGEVVFKSSVDSTEAFQIQNASGLSLLNFDTENTIIAPGFASSSESITRTYTNFTSASYDLGTEGLSFALGADNKPIGINVVNTGVTDQIVIYKCYEKDCGTGASEFVIPSIDTVVNNEQTGLIIGADGNPFIVYGDQSTGSAKLGIIHCNDHACTSDREQSILSSSELSHVNGRYPAVAIGADGYPIIAHRETSQSDLAVTKCNSYTCSETSGPNARTTNGNVVTTAAGISASIAIDGEGYPVIAHREGGSADILQITRCVNATLDCSSGITTTQIVNTNPAVNFGFNNKIIIINGLPLVVSISTTNDSLVVVRCLNYTCSGGIGTGYLINELALGSVIDTRAVGLMLGSDGLPLITYGSNVSSNRLAIIHCGTISCSSGNSETTLDLSGISTDGQFSKPIQGYDGMPMILTGSEDTLTSPSNNALAIARCVDVTCAVTGNIVLSGGVSLGSKNIPFNGLNFDTLNDSRPEARLRLTNEGKFYVNSLSTDTDGRVKITSESDESLKISNASSGTDSLKVDTSGVNINIIANDEFENSVSYWSANGSSTISQDPNNFNIGRASLAASNTAIAGEGVKYFTRLETNTVYVIRFAALASTGTISNMYFGYSADGSTESNCQSAQALTTSWQNFECVFTTPGSITGNPYLYVRRSDATSSTMNIDSVYLIKNGSASMITNTSFEGGTSGWSAKGTAVVGTTATAYAGVQAMNLSTMTAADNGGRFNMVLSPSKTYTVQFQTRLSAGTSSTIAFGYSYDGTTAGEQDCKNGQSVNTTYKLLTCTFSTPATISGTPYFYIETTATLGANTLFVDEAYLSPSGNELVIGNGNFESNTNGWAAHNSGTLASDNANASLNNSSMKVTTNVVGNSGAKYNVTLSPSTTYSAKLSAKLESGSLSTLVFGYSADGSTDTNCTTSGQTLSVSGWSTFTCSFTTSATIDTSAATAPYFFIKNTAASSVSFFVDNVQISAGSYATGAAESRTQINGVISSPLVNQAAVDSTTAFQILTSGGAPVLVADTLNSRLGVGTFNPSARFEVSGASGSEVSALINNGTSTGNILVLQDGGVPVLTVADGGLLTIKPPTGGSDSTTFIRVQNAAGTDLITVNTSNLRIELGTGVDIRLDGPGNARNAVTKIFTCTASEGVNEVVIITGSGTVGETTTAASNRVAGVVVAKPTGTTCTVAIEGLVQVSFGANAAPATIGDPIETSTAAGDAQSTVTPAVGAILGKSTSTKDGSNLVWVLLD